MEDSKILHDKKLQLNFAHEHLKMVSEIHAGIGATGRAKLKRMDWQLPNNSCGTANDADSIAAFAI